MTIEIISSSPRTESLTARVAHYLQKEFSSTTAHTVNLLDVREFPLPMIQNVWGSVNNTPDEWKHLAERIFAADAFVIVTPEYNGSYSPAMKNMFDHFPKQMHKAFGIVTASPGAMGGIRASQQLQQMICGIMGVPCPTMLIVPSIDKKFNDAYELIDHSFKNAIETFSHEFLWLAERLAG